MKLRSLALLFAFVLASAAARAQVGAYASFDSQQFTRNGLVLNPAAGSSNSDKPWLYGPTVGVYYMVGHLPKIYKIGQLKTGPIALGLDARGDFLRTAASAYSRDDGILSIRAAYKPGIGKFVPYIQGGAGIGHTKVPGQLNYTNNWSYLFAVGADRKIKGRIDWRVVEASAGFLGTYTAGSNPNNSNYMITLGTGIVVRPRGK
jgi:hypothetical protein